MTDDRSRRPTLDDQTDQRLRKHMMENRKALALVYGAVALDFVAVLAVGALAATLLGYVPGADTGEYESAFRFSLITAIVWVLALSLRGCYSNSLWNSGVQIYTATLSALPLVAAISLTAAFFIAKDVGGWYILLFFAGSTAAAIVLRRVFKAILQWVRQTGVLLTRVLLVGSNPIVEGVRRRLAESSINSVSIVGVLVPGKEGIYAQDGTEFSSLSDIAGFVQAEGVDEVLICESYFSDEEIENLCWLLRGAPTKVSVKIQTNYGVHPIVGFRVAMGIPMLDYRSASASTIQLFLKRLFDVASSGFLLLISFPLMALVALSILIEDGRPVLFKQKRVGLGSADFNCYKFRSMVRDADKSEPDLRAKFHTVGKMWKIENDPRVTATGTIIRRLSLDELPQLFNVLRGDMSMVGPRPKQRWEIDAYTEVQKRRFSVRPGLTGLSQISGRSDLSVDEAVQLDLDYMQKWSVVDDIFICLRTVTTVLRSSGAY